MKLKTYIFILSCFVNQLYFGQTINLGTPLCFKDKIHKIKDFYTTSTVDAFKQIETDKINQQISGDKIYRFGKEFSVDINIFEKANQTILPNGDILYQYGIYCPDAVSINVIFDQFELAQGVKLYLADAYEKSFDGAYTSLNNNVSKMLGTEIVFTQKAILEVVVPKTKIGQSTLHLSTIVYGYRNINDMAKALNSSAVCEIDVNCPLGNGWEEQRNSVAMLVNGGGFCSGSLINNTTGTIIPYLISAFHCGTTPGSWVFRFRWESPSGQVDCGTNANSVDGPQTMNVNGGVLKASNQNSDFILVELNSAPDPNWDIYYNGWDRTGIPATQLTGIHHPAGDIKKISRDDDTATDSSWPNTPKNSHWRVPSWDHGVTEGGSSGSPLFDQNHRLIGQLHGGQSGCGNDQNNLWDDYGKFSFSWDGIGKNGAKLNDYLDPQNIGSLFIDGINPNAPSVNFDAGVSTPMGISGKICGNTAAPKIILSNSGATTITTANINYGYDGINALNYTWNGILNLHQTIEIQLPTMTFTQGNHTFQATLINVNNSTDENSLNDVVASSFSIITDGEIDTLEIVLDKYGSETTWALTNANNQIIYAGGPYSDASNCPNITIKQAMCLNYGCYKIKFNDSYSDGMNTANCKGTFAIYRPDSTIKAQMLDSEANFGDSISRSFCIADDLSVEKLVFNDEILVYPNPTNTFITIDTKYMTASKIEVASIIGQIVYANESVNNQLQIDVANYPKGIYLVRIYTEKIGVITKQVVVN